MRTGTIDNLPWLRVAREMTWTKEIPGGDDSPIILGMAAFIAKKFPRMAAYCAEYTHDAIPWCGLNVAYDMARSDIAPQYVKGEDLKSFLWADAWRLFGDACNPRVGAVMVFTRNGGGHVSFYEDEDDDYYYVRGGNQSDMINVMRMGKDKFTGARWPSDWPLWSVKGVSKNG